MFKFLTAILLACNTCAYALGVANAFVPTGNCKREPGCFCNVSAQSMDSPSFSFPLCLGGKLTVFVDNPKVLYDAGFWINTNGRQHGIELFVTRYTGNIFISETRSRMPIQVQGKLNSPQTIDLGQIVRGRFARGYFVVVNSGGAKECTPQTPRLCIICASAQNVPCEFKDNLET